MNEEALARLRTEEPLAIVPGATHLLCEEGGLATAARLTADWLAKHLA